MRKKAKRIPLDMSRIQTLVSKAKNRNWVPSLFFVALAILGLFIYKDYGISWDEPIERLTGIVNLNYIGEFFQIRWIQNDPILSANSSLHLLQYSDRYFGPAFGIISVFLERLLRITDEQQIYFFRHLLNFAIFFGGVHALYQLATRRFSSWKMGLLAALMLILSPRLFGESFYNSKDLIFLSVFCIGLNSLVVMITKPTMGRAIAHGIITALVIDTRSIGIVLPALSVFYFIYGQYIHRANVKQTLSILFIYFAALSIFVAIFWPFLWSNPIAHFFETLGKFSKWGTTQVAVLYLGEFYQIQKTPLPWHYVFTWIAVTTPVVYLVFWGIGLTLTGYQLIKSKLAILKNGAYLQDLLFFSASLGPIIAIIVLHSIIYDGWRHLYFVYPSLLLISLKGIEWIADYPNLSSKIKRLLMGAFTIYLGSLGYWMIANHPNQNIFFNSLAGKNWNTKFDVDYWGLSTRQALEEIARIDNRPKILIYAGSVMSLNDSLRILSPEVRARFSITTNLDEANYIVSNYRNDLTDYAKPPHSYELVYEITSGREKIISVYKNLKTYSQLMEYSAGDIISFAKGQPGITLLGEGWAYPEDWGVWSDRHQASVVIPLTKKVRSITIELKGFIPRQDLKQLLDICFKGNQCKQIKLNDSTHREVELDIPKNFNGKSLSINFMIHSPFIPYQFGMGTDDRLIGIGLISVKVF